MDYAFAIKYTLISKAFSIIVACLTAQPTVPTPLLFILLNLLLNDLSINLPFYKKLVFNLIYLICYCNPDLCLQFSPDSLPTYLFFPYLFCLLISLFTNLNQDLSYGEMFSGQTVDWLVNKKMFICMLSQKVKKNLILKFKYISRTCFFYDILYGL